MLRFELDTNGIKYEKTTDIYDLYTYQCRFVIQYRVTISIIRNDEYRRVSPKISLTYLQRRRGSIRDSNCPDFAGNLKFPIRFRNIQMFGFTSSYTLKPSAPQTLALSRVRLSEASFFGNKCSRQIDWVWSGDLRPVCIRETKSRWLPGRVNEWVISKTVKQ